MILSISHYLSILLTICIKAVRHLSLQVDNFQRELYSKSTAVCVSISLIIMLIEKLFNLKVMAG
jgi:hypothetical protein